MVLELFQVFSISLLSQEMKAPVLVQQEPQSRRDAAAESAAVHKNRHRILKVRAKTFKKKIFT